jgi:signal recognition particle subunit SRP54
MFDSLSDKFSHVFNSIRGRGRLSEKDIDTTIAEIRKVLIDADVSLEAIDSFTTSIKEKALGSEVSDALNPVQQVIKIVHSELEEMLGKSIERRLTFAKNPPTVIMLAGLQGSGKTTFAAKLALRLKSEGHTPLLVAADLQRANAVEQLQVLAEQAKVQLYSPQEGFTSRFLNRAQNPVRVARDSIKYAKEKLNDIVIIDTAGRLGIDEELMKQARDIKNATQPNEVLFVIDSMIGQDAAKTARAFDKGVGISGVVLSKLDGDARGGAALSVVATTNKPILFASTGEKLEDLNEFHPDRMADRILDMGDVLSLIEEAEKSLDAGEAEKLADKLISGEQFDLDDFLSQLEQIAKLGSIKNLLAMMPGMNQYKKQLEQFDEREIDRTKAMIQSMTPYERRNPKKLNSSRKVRIAKGSGTSVVKLNKMLDGFKKMQKMMSGVGNQIAGDLDPNADVSDIMGGMGGMMPGGMGGNPLGGFGGFGGMMPGGPGASGSGFNKRGRKKGKKGKKGGKKGVSGNPAKRAGQLAQKKQDTLKQIRG